MYFLIYIINNCDTSDIDGAFAVVPFHWIAQIENHVQKFLNGGINTSQVHECYWSPLPRSSARIDHLLDHVPNFNIGFKSFPEEGNYLCKLLEAKRNHTFFLQYFIN